MSALGQKRTYAVQDPISAFTPRADMCSAQAHVCYGPIADISKETERPLRVSPKIHPCFNTLKPARSAALTLPLARSAASTQQV